MRRPWLESRVQAALEQPNCDFVLLSGEPGTGKSAFMLELAHDHPDWLRYFIRKDQITPFGEPSPRAVLLQTGFQLAMGHPDLFKMDNLRVAVTQRVENSSANSEIVGVEVDRLLASPFYQAIFDLEQQVHTAGGKVTGLKVGEWVTDPNLISLADLQNMALFDPARTLAEQKPAARLLVIIDALDELRYRSEGSALLQWLAELPELPPNLCFILTSRPDEVLLRNFRLRQAERLQEIVLGEEDSDMQQDVRSYATILAGEPAVRQVLEQGVGIDAFIDQAVARAKSNLGYLDAIGRAVDQVLENNQPQLLLQILDMQSLPDSLVQLYGAFLGWLRSAVEDESVEVEDRSSGEIHLVRAWTGVYYKITALLAVAVSPLQVSQMRLYGGILADEVAVTDAVQRMSQFLDHLPDGYRLYHTALAEYLTDMELHARTHTLDLVVDAAAWHQRVADVAWRRGTPGWEAVDAYALNALALHLAGAHDRERLKLMADRAWMAARFKSAGHTYAGFLEDLRVQRRNFIPADLPEDAAHLVLSALLTTGLAGLSDDLPPGLILRLVTSGVWSGERALDTVARSTKIVQVEKAYALLLEHAGLDETQKQTAQHGLQAARARLGGQTALADDSPPRFDFSRAAEQLQKAVRVAVEQVLQALKAQTEESFADNVDPPIPDWDALYKAMEAAYRGVSEQAADQSNSAQNLWEYLGVRPAFTLPQPRRERHRLLAAAVDWLAQAKDLSIFAPELLVTALQTVKEMPGDQKIQMLDGLVLLAPDQMVPGLLDAILVESGEPGFAFVLDQLASRLDAHQAEMAAATLRQAQSDTAVQVDMLLALLTVLPPARREVLLQACLSRIAQIPSLDLERTTSLQARYRLRVLPYLEGDAHQANLEQALEAIRNIPVRPNQTLVFKALEYAEWLPYLPQEQAAELAQTALKLVDVDEPVFVQYVLPALYPYLPAGTSQFAGLRVADADQAQYQELIKLTQAKKTPPPTDLVWQVLLSNVGELQYILPPGRTLRLLTPYLPDAFVAQAARIALDHPEDVESGQVLLILLPELEPELVLKIAQASWENYPASLRWKIKSAAARRLDEAQAAEFRQQAFDELAKLDDRQEQAALLGALAEVQPEWINGAAETFQELCWQLLQPLEQEPRSDYLGRCAALMPALGLLIKTEPVEMVSQALLKGLDWQWL